MILATLRVHWVDDMGHWMRSFPSMSKISEPWVHEATKVTKHIPAKKLVYEFRQGKLVTISNGSYPNFGV